MTFVRSGCDTCSGCRCERAAVDPVNEGSSGKEETWHGACEEWTLRAVGTGKGKVFVIIDLPGKGES